MTKTSLDQAGPPPSAPYSHTTPASMSPATPGEGKGGLEDAGPSCAAGPQSPFSAWLGRAEAASLILSTPDPRQAQQPTAALGVSVAYLSEFAQTLGSASKYADTSTVVNKLITVLNARPPCLRRGRYFDMIPAKYTGKPHYYVIYAWQTPFHFIIDQLVRNLADGDDTGYSDKHKASNTFLWLDWVALNQQPSVSTELGHVKDLARSCSQGALVVLDSKLAPMSRSWCLYEMWCFVYYASLSHLRVWLPRDKDVDTVVKLEGWCERLDIGKSESTKPQDSSRILTEVKSAVGMKFFHKLLRDALHISIHCTLRWSDDKAELGLYAESLLCLGEYGQLLHVLHCIPELEDNAETLREIREIYEAYDTDGSGNLEEDEFVQVLMAAGFQEEESSRMFKDVNTDGDDGVSLEEFETWWMETQRTEASALKQRKAVLMKPEVLQQSLTKLVALLERAGLVDEAAGISGYLQMISAGKIVKDKSDLTLPPLRGEWRELCDECCWKLHMGDVRSSSVQIYDMLMQNADQLDLNPRLILNPKTITDPEEFCMEVGNLLQHLTALLQTHGVKKQQLEMFNGFIQELHKPMSLSAMANNMASAEARCKNSAEGTRFKIVRGMIGMKYGVDVPLSKPLIVEAEKALGQWMASKKDKVLNDLYHTYLKDTTPFKSSSQQDKRPSEFMQTMVKRDIPAEGPYVSLLNFLGSDAKTYLAELQAKEALEEMMHDEDAGDNTDAGFLPSRAEYTNHGVGMGLSVLGSTSHTSNNSMDMGLCVRGSTSHTSSNSMDIGLSALGSMRSSSLSRSDSRVSVSSTTLPHNPSFGQVRMGLNRLDTTSLAGNMDDKIQRFRHTHSRDRLAHMMATRVSMDGEDEERTSALITKRMPPAKVPTQGMNDHPLKSPLVTNRVTTPMRSRTRREALERFSYSRDLQATQSESSLNHNLPLGLPPRQPPSFTPNSVTCSPTSSQSSPLAQMPIPLAKGNIFTPSRNVPARTSCNGTPSAPLQGLSNVPSRNVPTRTSCNGTPSAPLQGLSNAPSRNVPARTSCNGTPSAPLQGLSNAPSRNVPARTSCNGTPSAPLQGLSNVPSRNVPARTSCNGTPSAPLQGFSCAHGSFGGRHQSPARRLVSLNGSSADGLVFVKPPENIPGSYFTRRSLTFTGAPIGTPAPPLGGPVPPLGGLVQPIRGSPGMRTSLGLPPLSASKLP